MGCALELLYLVAPVGDTRVAVLPLGVDVDGAAEGLGHAGEGVDGRGAEEEVLPRDVRERDVHVVCLRKRGSGLLLWWF